MADQPSIKKILLVARDHNHALITARDRLPQGRMKTFESNDHSLMVTWPTASLMGRRFDEIRVSSKLVESQSSLSNKESTRQWLRESVTCRLLPGGQMHEVDEL